MVVEEEDLGAAAEDWEGEARMTPMTHTTDSPRMSGSKRNWKKRRYVHLTQIHMHDVNDSCFNTHSILQAEAAQLNKELAETAAKHKREQEVRI